MSGSHRFSSRLAALRSRRTVTGAILTVAALGAATFVAFTAITAPDATAAARVDLVGDCPNLIQRGSSGECVTTVQELLNAKGANVDTDGEFGEQTEQAVTTFQSDNGLEADGVVGPKTKAALQGDSGGGGDDGGDGGNDGGGSGQCPSAEAQKIADLGIESGGPGAGSAQITFWSTHFASGVDDNASAFENIQAAQNGEQAARSTHGTAPGGSVCLDSRMLNGLAAVAQDHKLVISEIAGASHSATSRHYRGTAFDLAIVDGTGVGALGGDTIRSIAKTCQDNGATEVLHPLNDSAHSTHIHCAWPDA
jgi:zinc D-Ala-D-Ala carboxypeptidase